MAYDWYDEIDSLIWHFESKVEEAAKGRGMIGMAPSAGDEARARLRRVAADVSPRELVDEVEKLSRSDINGVVEALALGAVDRAHGRGSRHVTREDVSAALNAEGAYPFVRE